MATYSIENQFTSPKNSPQGLAWDGTDLWVSAATDTIYRVDPADGTVLQTFAAPTSNTYGIVWIDSFLWASDTQDDRIYKINPSDGSVVDFISSPSFGPHGLAWDGTHLWNADVLANHIYKLDLSGTVVHDFPSIGSQPAGIAWDGSNLWNVDFDDDLVYHINADTGESFDSLVPPPEDDDSKFPLGLVWDGEFLWLSEGNTHQIFKLKIMYFSFDGVGSSSSSASSSGFILNKNMNAVGASSGAASADLEALFEPALWAFDLTNAYGFKERGGNIPSAIEGVGSSASSASARLTSETDIEGGVGSSTSYARATELDFMPPSPSGTCDWVEIGTVNIGSAYSNATRITVREIDQYRLLVLAPDTTNGNTAWSLVHADFWGVEVISSGTFGSFDVRDSFPVAFGKLLAVGTDNRVSVIVVSGDSVSFGSTYTLTPVATPSTGVGYGPSGTDDQFIQAWGEGTGSWDVPGQRQWARAWNISGQTISAGSDEQQYLDVAGYTGGNNGMSPHLGVHHFKNGILMPFGNRYYYTSRTYATDQGCGVIVKWDGSTFTFVPGPDTWYTDGSWYYGSGGQRNPHFEVDDGGDCAAAYAVYDNVSGYDHGFHRYGLNSTEDGITVKSLKHGIGLVENSLASISLGETTIAMGDQKESRATSPRAVNICTMDNTWSMHSYHGLPHSSTQYGIGCGTTDRIAVGVWGDGNDVTRKLRAWYR